MCLAGVGLMHMLIINLYMLQRDIVIAPERKHSDIWRREIEGGGSCIEHLWLDVLQCINVTVV